MTANFNSDSLNGFVRHPTQEEIQRYLNSCLLDNYLIVGVPFGHPINCKGSLQKQPHNTASDEPALFGKKFQIFSQKYPDFTDFPEENRKFPRLLRIERFVPFKSYTTEVSMTKKHHSKHSSLNGFVRHPTQEEVQRYLNSCLLDNYLMNVCFSDNNEAAQLIVTTLLGRDDITVTETSVQKYLANFKTKSSILDILAKDTQGKIYNIELQRVVKKASPLRARYYNSLIDRDLLKKSEDYEQLPELYIIFVTDGDYFKKGKQVYNVVRKVEETGEVYKDKVHIIYADAKHQDASPVGKLLSDLTCPDPEKIHNKVLSDAVREAKTEGGKRMGMWVEGYSMYEKERWDEAHSVGLNEGRTLGLNEGLAKGRTLGLNEGMSKGRETEKNAWIANLKQLGVAEDVINAAASLSDKSR